MKDPNFWLSILGSSTISGFLMHFITKRQYNAQVKKLEFEGANTHISGTKNFMEIWENTVNRFEKEIKMLKEERKVDQLKINELYKKLSHYEEENMVYKVCIRDHDIDFNQWMHNFKKDHSN